MSIKFIHILKPFILFFSILFLFNFCLPQVYAADYYDLTVEGIDVEPADPEIGENVVVTIEIKNNGTLGLYANPGLSSCDYNFTDFTQSKINYPPISLTPLNPGESTYYTIEGSFSKTGDKRLSFSIDAENQLEENNENNNTFSTDFVMEDYYDLLVEDIDVDPINPEIGENVIIRVKIKNNGTINLYSNIGLSSHSYNFTDFTESKIYYPTFPQGPVNPGGYAYYTIEGSFSKKGSKDLYFRVDEDDQLAESNESNNDIRANVVINAHDLGFEEITITPEKPTVGQECIIKIILKNTGTLPMYSSVGVSSFEYDFPNFELLNITTPNITLAKEFSPDDTVEYIFKGHFDSGGNKTLKFEVDVADQLEELDEDNNVISKNVDVFRMDQVDLSIDTIEFSIDDPIVDEELEITINIKNSGLADIVSDKGILHDWFLSRDYVIEPDIRTDFFGFDIVSFSFNGYPTIENILEPDDTFEYKYTGRFKRAGLNSVDFEVDVNNRLVESDETNNISSTHIQVYQAATERDYFKISNVNFSLVSATSTIVTWNTDKETKGKLSYKVLGRVDYDRHVEDDDESTSHSITVDDLYPNTRYEYRVVAYNRTAEKEVLHKKFITPRNHNVIITTPPTTSPTHKISKSSINIIWSTNFISDSYVYYKKNSDPDYQKVWETADVINHSVSLDKLEPGEYSYYVTSASTVGTVVKSDVYGFYFMPKKEPEKVEQIEQKEVIPEKTQFQKEQEKYQTEIDIIKNGDVLYSRAKGRIVLLVESHGEAWYFNPTDNKRYYLGRPIDAYNVMVKLGIGITNANLEKIQIGDEYILQTERSKVNYNFANIHKGKIFLQVELHGEAWYVNPTDLKRYYLGRPADAFRAMRELSIGMKNDDFVRLQQLEKTLEKL